MRGAQMLSKGDVFAQGRCPTAVEEPAWLRYAHLKLEDLVCSHGRVESDNVVAGADVQADADAAAHADVPVAVHAEKRAEARLSRSATSEASSLAEMSFAATSVGATSVGDVLDSAELRRLSMEVATITNRAVRVLRAQVRGGSARQGVAVDNTATQAIRRLRAAAGVLERAVREARRDMRGQQDGPRSKRRRSRTRLPGVQIGTQAGRQLSAGTNAQAGAAVVTRTVERVHGGSAHRSAQRRLPRSLPLIAAQRQPTPAAPLAAAGAVADQSVVLMDL